MIEYSEIDYVRTVSLIRDKILACASGPGNYPTAIEGLTFVRRDVPNIPEICFNKPIVALTLQGAKRTVVGTEEYQYGAGHCLIAGVDLPSMSHITRADSETPYLVLTLEIDPGIISGLITRPAAAETPVSSVRSGAAIAPLDLETLKAFLRLVDVLDNADEARFLGPTIVREIHTRLLLGQQGAALRALNTAGTQSNRIFNAINWLRGNFTRSFEVTELAKMVHMAPPTFRRHFKTITTMSPTRYHQHLRLYEAQRLMLVDGIDAQEAGYSVGYESPTQFYREYRRLFGEPPARNVDHVRQTARTIHEAVHHTGRLLSVSPAA